jgi:hypothetical protein
MSAYGIGADTATTDAQGKNRENKSETNAPATIVKWIPGEAVTFYAAILGVGAVQGQLTGNESAEQVLERINAGSAGWFIVGVVVACALVLIGSATAPRESERKVSPLGLFIRLLLTIAAFTLWTSALPGSWTYNWHFIRDLGPAYAILLVPIGIVFAAVAEWATKNRNW